MYCSFKFFFLASSYISTDLADQSSDNADIKMVIIVEFI